MAFLLQLDKFVLQMIFVFILFVFFARKLVFSNNDIADITSFTSFKAIESFVKRASQALNHLIFLFDYFLKAIHVLLEVGKSLQLHHCDIIDDLRT